MSRAELPHTFTNTFKLLDALHAAEEEESEEVQRLQAELEATRQRLEATLADSASAVAPLGRSITPMTPQRSQ